MKMNMKNEMQTSEIQIIVRTDGHVEARFDPRNQGEQWLASIARPWADAIAYDLQKSKRMRRFTVLPGGSR